MRMLALILLLSLPQVAQAATTYIDPTCTHNGDGTTTECAASADAAGAMNVWPTVTGAGNSFLQKAGTTSLLQVSVNSGSAGNPVIMGAYGTGAKPIIRSEENVTVGTIKINTDAHDITIDGLEVHGPLNVTAGVQSNAIRNNVGVGLEATVVNITIQNCDIKHVFDYGGSSAEDDGIDLRGQGLIVQDSTFDDIANDAVWLASKDTANDMIIRRNTCSRVSQGGTNGDCYQVSGTSTGALIELNDCDHSDVDSKQCIVANNDTTIRYNTNLGPIVSTVHIGIYCDVGPCRIYGNTVRYGKVGIANYGTTGGYTVGNLVLSPATYGIEVNAASSPVVNNTIDRVAEDTVGGNGFAAIRLTSSATNATAWNNIVSDSYEGIRLTSASGHTESNNLFHGTITRPVYNTTTAGTLTPTSPVTASSQLTTDYKLKGASTGKRAGRSSPYCIDLRGRVCQSPPDIGAYQSSSGDPAATRAARN